MDNEDFGKAHQFKEYVPSWYNRRSKCSPGTAEEGVLYQRYVPSWYDGHSKCSTMTVGGVLHRLVDGEWVAQV